MHFLIRGEVEKKGPIAKPGFAQVLMNRAVAEQHWLRNGDPENPVDVLPRIALATWITDLERSAGHLLARVIVNRLWQHHLGRGIVGTSNDFGSQGDPPTHPELLDYLARELVNGGWKLKPMHKLIMTSAVYMQANSEIPANVRADPKNHLWCAGRCAVWKPRPSATPFSPLPARWIGGCTDQAHSTARLPTSAPSLKMRKKVNQAPICGGPSISR